MYKTITVTYVIPILGNISNFMARNDIKVMIYLTITLFQHSCFFVIVRPYSMIYCYCLCYLWFVTHIQQVRCEADDVGLYITEITEDEDGLPNVSENSSSNVATSPSPPHETPHSSAPLRASSKRTKKRKVQTPTDTSEDLSNSNQIIDIMQGSLNYVNNTRD